MCKVWQKVCERADVFPSFMDVDVPGSPPMELENSRGRRQDGDKNAKRCAREAGAAYYQLPEGFERSEVRK